MTGIFGLKIHGWKELLHDTLEIWTHQKGERHISETDWAMDKVTAVFFDLFLSLNNAIGQFEKLRKVIG